MVLFWRNTNSRCLEMYLLLLALVGNAVRTATFEFHLGHDRSSFSPSIAGGWCLRRTDRLILHAQDDHTEENAGEDNEQFQDTKFLERNARWIIVVDDEEDIRLAVGDFLYDRGYQVTACADADSMLEVCATPNAENGELPAVPDAIISDVRMPGKDGIELLGLIRADERLARVPVILLTAKAMTQDRVAGYKAGADVYLPKPFDPDELLSIVDNAIQRRQQMIGRTGSLIDLKEEMATIKQIMRRTSAGVVKKTDVYLTDMERDVLELVSKGYSNAEIAKERNVGVIGINRVIQKLYLRTETRTRTELVRWALSTGYISPKI